VGKLLYVVNNAAFFVSHRLPLAIESARSGLDVGLIIGKPGSEEMEARALLKLELSGIACYKVNFSSAGVNPFLELLGFLQILYFMVRFKPDIVHCVSPKGVVYGGIAARLCRVKSLILAISGMGFLYTNQGKGTFPKSIIKMLYSLMLKITFLHKNFRVIVQNGDDFRAVITEWGVPEGRVIKIMGSGVNLQDYLNCTPLNKKNIVLLPARMLLDKGVIEFVEASCIVKRMVPSWAFILAGAAGYDNPSAITEDRLVAFQNSGCIHWLRHVDDIIALYRDAAIVCLPSYREGMPKALLEAAAAGCAIVTTDVIGCREAIDDGVTGDLVPARDVNALADAMISLINDQQRRISYGIKGQERARNFYSIDSVILQTISIYNELLRYE